MYNTLSLILYTIITYNKRVLCPMLIVHIRSIIWSLLWRACFPCFTFWFVIGSACQEYRLVGVLGSRIFSPLGRCNLLYFLSNRDLLLFVSGNTRTRRTELEEQQTHQMGLWGRRQPTRLWLQSPAWRVLVGSG